MSKSNPFRVGSPETQRAAEQAMRVLSPEQIKAAASTGVGMLAELMRPVLEGEIGPSELVVICAAVVSLSRRAIEQGGEPGYQEAVHQYISAFSEAIADHYMEAAEVFSEVGDQMMSPGSSAIN